jgi:hypothetical protein
MQQVNVINLEELHRFLRREGPITPGCLTAIQGEPTFFFFSGVMSWQTLQLKEAWTVNHVIYGFLIQPL